MTRRRHTILKDGPLRLTERQFLVLVDDDTGICRACGAEQANCEPDARQYRCESCGAREVYGTEELLCREEISIR